MRGRIPRHAAALADQRTVVLSAKGRAYWMSASSPCRSNLELGSLDPFATTSCRWRQHLAEPPDSVARWISARLSNPATREASLQLPRPALRTALLQSVVVVIGVVDVCSLGSPLKSLRLTALPRGMGCGTPLPVLLGRRRRTGSGVPQPMPPGVHACPRILRIARGIGSGSSVSRS